MRPSVWLFCISALISLVWVIWAYLVIGLLHSDKQWERPYEPHVLAVLMYAAALVLTVGLCSTFIESNP